MTIVVEKEVSNRSNVDIENKILVGISQPRYLPAINYLQRIHMCDTFVLLDNVQHQPRAFEHRNKIKTANGPKWLSIPIDRTRNRMIIRDLHVVSFDWIENHRRQIHQQYRQCAYYSKETLDQLFDFGHDSTHFVTLIERMLAFWCELFLIDAKIIRASDLALMEEHDSLLAEITRSMCGDVYVSGPNGRDYLDKTNFAGLDIMYHHFEYPVYSQAHGEFVPWMSCLDNLFNQGLDATRDLIHARPQIESQDTTPT